MELILKLSEQDVKAALLAFANTKYPGCAFNKIEVKAGYDELRSATISHEQEEKGVAE